MAQTKKKANNKAVKKPDPHAITKIPEGITPDQLKAQTTMEIPFQFALDLRETFKKSGFGVHKIEVEDLTDMSFKIDYKRYRNGRIVDASDRITISSHQMIPEHYTTMYYPMLKGEINIISGKLQCIYRKKFSKLEKDLDKIVDFFVGTINSSNMTDLWMCHYDQLKNDGMKQSWRIGNLCNEWIKDQNYQTMKGSKSYHAFE